MKRIIRDAAVLTGAMTLLFGIATVMTPAKAQVSGGISIGNHHEGLGIWVDGSPNWRDEDQGYQFGNGWDSDAGSIVWRGSVDDRAEIYFQGDQWSSDVLSGDDLRDQHVRVFDPLPNNEPEHVRLARVQGRGDVFIFQQPNADNNYTAGVQVHDPQAGRGNYRFALVWD